MKLTEGEVYKFEVEREVKIEGIEYFLLSGPGKKRHLLT